MALALRLEGVGKSYTLVHERRARYETLRDTIADGVRDTARRLAGRGGRRRAEREEFWALRDVTLDVGAGERLAVIGRNGAGKSTLLKLVSRITEPTTGRIGINGQVSSLLEVGTGFHPELTGRENIYLNGSVLGMRRAEIARKFDEIVAFAEIERFLDTPVKRYSSGMYVRLAFAVAAHLEPDVLIVDEVLAVGDAAFQKKCLGKMGEVAGEGRTLLFVSHNMGAVSSLCSRGVYLRDGRVAHDGPIAESVARYVESWSEARGGVADLGKAKRQAWAHLRFGARLEALELVSAPSGTPWQLPFGREPVLRVRVSVRRPLPGLELGVALSNSALVEVASSLSTDSVAVGPLAPGQYEFTATFRSPGLMPGTYALGFGLKTGESDFVMEDYLPEAASFEVTATEASAALRTYTRRGAFLPDVGYEFRPVEDGG